MGQQANDGTVTDPVTPVPQVVLPTAPPPPSAPDPDVFNPEGKKWRDLFHGVSGSTQVAQDKLARRKGEFEATINDLTAQIAERDAQLTQLNEQLASTSATVTSLQEQMDQFPALQERAALADKLTIFMRFPTLVAARVEETVTAEDGTETTKVVNPYLRAIESMTLSGPELETALGQMAKLAQAPAPTQTSALTPPTVPAPAPPADQGENLATLEKKRDDFMALIQQGDPTQWGAYHDVCDEITELRRQGE